MQTPEFLRMQNKQHSHGRNMEHHHHSKLDHEKPILEEINRIVTIFRELRNGRTTPGHSYDKAHPWSMREYFKITIHCLDYLDGMCAPRMQIKRS